MTQASLTPAAFSFMLNAVLASLTLDPNRTVEDLKTEREAAAAMLAALQPRDAIEAALASRAVAAHHAALECFRRAAAVGLSDQMMTRLFASGMALSRMSLQMTRAIETRQRAATRSAGSANPLEAALAAMGTQHPMPSETRPAPAAADPAKQPSPTVPQPPAPKPSAAGAHTPPRAAGAHNPPPVPPAAQPSMPPSTRTPHPEQSAIAPDALPPVMTREQLAPFATLTLALMDAA